MSALEWRPVTLADVPELIRLDHAVAKHEGDPHLETEAGLADDLADTAWTMALDTQAAVAPDGTIAGWVGMAPPPAGGTRIDAWGRVHPDARGRGIGRRLLGWQLDRAAEQYAEAGATGRWEFQTSVLDSDSEAARLFARYGLAPARYWFDMDRPVADPIPSVELADGLEIVPFEGKYEDAVYHAHMEAFLDHWGFQHRPQEEWRKRFDSADFRPRQSLLVLTRDAEIAGYLLSMAFADPTRMTMTTIGTRRPWRRKGVASALMAAALEAYRAAGVTTANLGVDTANPSGAVGVYERMGFRTIQTVITFSRPIGG